jgi:hypothetical protein
MVEVGHKTPSLLDAIQDFGRTCRRGACVAKREPVDHFSSPLVLNELGAPSLIRRRRGRQRVAIGFIPLGNELPARPGIPLQNKCYCE